MVERQSKRRKKKSSCVACRKIHTVGDKLSSSTEYMVLNSLAKASTSSNDFRGACLRMANGWNRRCEHTGHLIRFQEHSKQTYCTQSMTAKKHKATITALAIICVVKDVVEIGFVDVDSQIKSERFH